MGRRPIWTEGLLVSQHHFQAQDRYHEDLLRERLSTLRRFSWGISALEIDDRLLQAGQFGLRRLVAVWPDGVVVQCGGQSGDPLPEPRPFESHMRAEDATLDVLVGITTEGGANVAPHGEPVTQQRFGRSTRNMDDANTGGAAQEVEFAVPNLRIVFGTERRERMLTVPVAQLVRQADGRAVVRDTFVPPVLDVAAAPFVTTGLRRVLGAMVARQRELAAGRKQRSSSSIEFHYTDARRFWLLHTLSGAIPVLSHLLDASPVHPEEVYLALATVVGQLATFSAETDLSMIVPRFDYGRLGDVFEPLFARALSLVSVDSAPVYTEIPLQRRSDGMFVGKLQEARLANHEFFIAVRGSLPEATVRERIPQLLKVADWKHIVEVVKQARHGVRAEVDWNPSSSLPLKPGVCFFRLRREGPFWEEIAKSGTLALYLPSDADWKDAWLGAYAVDPTYLR
jgi:type VI secretion system protein ImpJ